MPKQTSNIQDFSKGMNYHADDTDLFQLQSVKMARNVHFDRLGKIVAFNGVHNTFTFGDAEANTSGNISGDYVDLDRGIGHLDPDNGDALTVAVSAPVDSPSDDLSWEDGNYDFKYTVCKDLGNGNIEEGPLQSFDGSGGTNVDMSTDNKGKFTFTHTGNGADATPGHPDHMNTDTYEGKLCGRVYYSRRQGQGSTTQVGWIHLCDLVLVLFDADSNVMPRAVNTTGTPSNNYINIEEPPTSASFEMNALYPNDVGILDVSADDGIFSSVESKVVLGMVTYVAKGGYIYRSVPGQPDIFPTDNWIDMTAYGTTSPCKAMYGIGDLLCYFTVFNLIIFNVTNDTIVKTMKGYGIALNIHSAKLKEGIVFRPYGTYLNNSDLYYFDGNQIANLTKNRHREDAIAIDYFTTEVKWPLQYQKGLDWIRYPSYYLNAGTAIIISWIYYSFKTDTIFEGYQASEDSGSTWIELSPQIDTGAWHANDPTRYKKVYKIVVYGILNTTMTLKVIKEDHDGSEHTMTSSYTGGNGSPVTWTLTPDSSLKVRKLYFKFEDLSTTAGEGELWHIGIVYRMLNKF